MGNIIDTATELKRFIAPQFTFGINARRLIAKKVKTFPVKKVLLVSDPGVVAAGWTDDVAMCLEEANIAYTLFIRCTPNPKAQEVMDGAEVFRTNGCNVIVCVGGGSVMDCAKGIGLVVGNNKHILEFEGVDRVDLPKPPLICIPTTGGTSSDLSQFAIITNPQERVKIAIISAAVVPDISLIDPTTLTTMGHHLAACTAMDALVHAIEAFVSTGATPITDLHALAGINLIASNIIPSLEAPNDMGLRANIMRGSLEAGLAFSNASLGGVHAMAHSLGGYKDLPHGECNAMLLRHVMDFNYDFAADRYAAIGNAMNIDLKGMPSHLKKKLILDEIERLAYAVNINKTLSGYGVGSSDIGVLAKNAGKDACMTTNPRKANKRDIEVLFEEAL